MNPKDSLKPSEKESQELSKRRKLQESINKLKMLKRNQKKSINQHIMTKIPGYKDPTLPAQMNRNISAEQTNEKLILQQNQEPGKLKNDNQIMEKSKSWDLKTIKTEQNVSKQKCTSTPIKQQDATQMYRKQKLTANSTQSTKRSLEQTDLSHHTSNTIQRTFKKVKGDISDNPNYSTAIQISSDEDSISQKRGSLQKDSNTNTENEQKWLMKDKQQETRIRCKLSPQVKTNLNSMFSTYKLTYVKFSQHQIVKYYREKSKLQHCTQDEIKNKHRIRLDSNYISVARTINIQFISEKILKKQWVTDDSKSYCFWMFRGTLKNFQDLVIETVLNNQRLIENKKLVRLDFLYDWYTLAHLLSLSTNLVIICQKLQPSPVIRNLHQQKCTTCNKSHQKTCLCLKFWLCMQKPSSREEQQSRRRHSLTCKYAFPFKKGAGECAQFSEDSKKGLIGLVNSQNSCFMNTAIQCLASCQHLTQYFIEKQYIKNINYGNHLGTFGQIATCYAQFLSTTFTTQKPVLQMNKLKKGIFRWKNKYLNDQQEDSQQFLIQLLDWLKQDLNLNNIRPQYNREIDNQKQSIEQQSNLAWKDHLSRNNSIIEYLMAGMLKSSIQCLSCLYESCNFQTFLTLPLPIYKTQFIKQEKFTIKVCLVSYNFRKKNYFREITLESYYYEHLIEQVKKSFNLPENSDVIGVFHDKETHFKIETTIQKQNAIEKAKQSPKQLHLFFLQYPKRQLSQENVQIVFQVKFKFKNSYCSISCQRFLYFTKIQGSTPKIIFKKLLKYFYSMMFKNQNNITEEEYLSKYLNSQNAPFTVFLAKQNIQIFINDQIQLRSKTKIFVHLQNDKIFDVNPLIKSASLPKQTKPQYNQPIQKNNITKVSIYDCFKEFEKTDQIDLENSWHCPNCDKKRKAQKKMSIYKSPKILILFFKRFDAHSIQNQYGDKFHTMKKIETFVDFPHELDLSSFVQKKQLPYTSEIIQPKYRLFAVANHINLGTPEEPNGHYIAFVNHSNEWFKINDQHIHPIGQGDVCTKNAYILFYQRQQQ